jgi:sporulation related protein
MARSNAAGMNGGWPPQRQPEHDPRGARPGQGQHPGQPGQAPGYAQPGYPDPQAGYDPQMGYHYPQQQPQGQPQHQQPQGQQQPAPAGSRQGLSSLDSLGQRHGNDFPSYQQPAQSPYGQPQQPQGYGQPGHQDPHAQQGVPPFRPAPASPFGNNQPVQPSPYEQWQQPQAQPHQQPHQPMQDPLGYDLGGYLPNGAQPADPHHQPQHGDWNQGHHGYGDPAMGEDPYQTAHHGYEPAHGGALEQAYGHDEAGEYEVEEPRRGSWALRIAGAVVVAIGLGYGLAQGYKLVAGSSPDGAPPIVKGDSAPSKIKPDDPGGREFAHQDSKILGRLGEGAPESGSLASDADAGGTRRVQTLVVGRDGQIAPPAAPEETGAVSIPGVTVVDGFGGGFPATSPSPTPPANSQPAQERKPVVIKPPKTEPVAVAAVSPPAVNKPPMPKKSTPAAVKRPAPAASSGASGGNGFVAVLASVPASGGSRLTALRKFADMQQQYGDVLRNKTPDVREANLGERGVYHRLLVGPPGSRSQASSVCSELKTAGYKDCWVTAY